MAEAMPREAGKAIRSAIDLYFLASLQVRKWLQRRRLGRF